MIEVVTTDAAPNPIGPYSQAIKANGFVFATGQIPLDPTTQELVKGGIDRQTKRALQNVSSLLEAAGTSMRKVVRCVVYLKTMDDFAGMNEVYATFFREKPPVRTTIEASRLPMDCLIEIEATALE
ncbi:Rid family detoxifying hydrolase [bacterium]|nr:Rid family detoxifying hydrolase [bacterium]